MAGTGDTNVLHQGRPSSPLSRFDGSLRAPGAPTKDACNILATSWRGKVRHESVCAIHECGDDGALQFICMELIDGGRLSAHGGAAFQTSGTSTLEVHAVASPADQPFVISVSRWLDSRGYGAAAQGGVGRAALVHVLPEAGTYTADLVPANPGCGTRPDLRIDYTATGTVTRRYESAAW